jgi:hypothetical protein
MPHYATTMVAQCDTPLQLMQIFKQAVAVCHMNNHHCSIAPHAALMLCIMWGTNTTLELFDG